MSALRAPRQLLAEGEDVRRLVLAPMAAVQLAHRRVVDEGEGDLHIARERIGTQRRADGLTDAA